MITEQTIIGVTRKSVNKKDGSPLTLFEIETAEGTTWTTAKEALALEAHSRVGHLTAIDGKIEENGRFTNHYLNGLADPGTLNATITDVNSIASAIPERVSYIERAQQTWPTSDEPRTEDPHDRQESIYRQVACKVSASMSGTSEEFWQNVQILMEFFRTGMFPHTKIAPEGNQFIPEQEKVPVAAGFDDDLPF